MHSIRFKWLVHVMRESYWGWIGNVPALGHQVFEERCATMSSKRGFTGFFDVHDEEAGVIFGYLGTRSHQ